MDFAQVESEYGRLKAQVAAGQISEDEFKAKLQELMIQDEQGRWWVIGFETGRWYVHDGKAWVQGQPPSLASSSEVSAAEAGTEPVASPPIAPPAQRQPAAPSGRKPWLWIAPALLVVGIVAILALRLLAPRAAEPVAALPPTQEPTAAVGASAGTMPTATFIATATPRKEATPTPAPTIDGRAATATVEALLKSQAAAAARAATSTAEALAAAAPTKTATIKPTALPTDTPKPTTAPTSTVTPKPTSTIAPKPPPTTSSARSAPAAVAQPGMIFDFEDFGSWRRGDEPYGSFTQSNEQKRSGSYAGKLSYDFPAVQNNYVVFLRLPPLALPGQPDALTLWVFGDGSKHFLNAWIRDAQGEVRQFTFGQVSHKDSWQPMTSRLDTAAPWPQGHISGPDNGRLDSPISLEALVLDGVPDGAASKGVLYLDDLMTAQKSGAAPTTSSGTAPGLAVSQPQGPLGGHIVFTTDNGGSSEVDVLDVATRATRRLFSNARQPDVRGDGRVVMNGIGGGKNNLITVNLDGSREIISGAHPEDSYPHWSPSGLSTVFHSTLQGDGKERIYIQWDMTHVEEPKRLTVGSQDLYGQYPTWLESWRITFSGCDYWADGSHCGIWAVNSDGKGAPLRLTERIDDHSTDGANGVVLFASRLIGNWEIYAIAATGGVARNLTNSPSQDVGATFSPDGGYIAFMSDRGGSWGIWVMNAAGSNPQRLLAVANGFGSNWSDERLGWSQ